MKTVIKILLLLVVFVIFMAVLTGVAYKVGGEKIKEWTAKEWNINGDLFNYEVGCEKRVKKLPMDELLLNTVLGALEIRLHHGEGQSYVSFLGSNVQNFTTPDIIVDHPVVPFTELKERINDINSDNISVDIIKEESAVEIKITFEENGYEIKGDDWNDVDVDLNDMEVSFKLGLTVVEPGVLGYDEATADFSIGSVDVGGLKGVVLNIFRDQIKDYIEDGVTAEMQKALDEPEIKRTISDALMSPLRALWIQDIVSVEYNVDSITIYAR